MEDRLKDIKELNKSCLSINRTSTFKNFVRAAVDAIVGKETKKPNQSSAFEDEQIAQIKTDLAKVSSKVEKDLKCIEYYETEIQKLEAKANLNVTLPEEREEYKCDDYGELNERVKLHNQYWKDEYQKLQERLSKVRSRVFPIDHRNVIDLKSDKFTGIKAEEDIIRLRSDAELKDFVQAVEISVKSKSAEAENCEN
ncbi:hypothetical protein ACOME3_002188 [Neoechinorhynchus agilis]